MGFECAVVNREGMTVEVRIRSLYHTVRCENKNKYGGREIE